MEIPEQIWLLIARNLSGEASKHEQQELATFLRNDEQLQQHYDLLARVWIDKQSNLQHEDNGSINNIVSRIINKAQNDEPIETFAALPLANTGNRRYWLVAASVVIAGLASWLWINNRSSTLRENKQAVIEAQKGSRTRSVLPDGSTVWLNAGSKLYYENDFAGATREVRLDGEAFFDIIKKPDHPFIVHTSGIDIKVLGTAFNVKSYPEDKTVETTLYRGSVQVFRHEESEKKAIQLKPNEKLILVKQAAIEPENLSQKTKTLSADRIIPAISTIAPIDSTKKENERIETGWVYNRLTIWRENFEEIARKLERWYNVSIYFTDEQVKDISFTVTFDGETLEKVFAYFKMANPSFDYRIINNHEIYIGSANSLER